VRAGLEEWDVEVWNVVSQSPCSQVEVAVSAERGPLQALAPVARVAFGAVDAWVLWKDEARSTVASGGAWVAGGFDRVNVVVVAGHENSF